MTEGFLISHPGSPHYISFSFKTPHQHSRDFQPLHHIHIKVLARRTFGKCGIVFKKFVSKEKRSTQCVKCVCGQGSMMPLMSALFCSFPVLHLNFGGATRSFFYMSVKEKVFLHLHSHLNSFPFSHSMCFIDHRAVPRLLQW